MHRDGFSSHNQRTTNSKISQEPRSLCGDLANEKRLNPEEKEMMRTAKGKEVREFNKEKAVARLLEGEHVDPKNVMRMGFVLTWKKDP